ncbi:MAG: YhdP family protein [Lysobacteraceae bacterium]
MHAPHRRRWRHLRRALGYGGLVALILLAALVGLTNQLLPAVERHPEDVAAWLSERVGQPVRFSAIDARWTRRGPRLSLRDLEVGEGDATLAVGEAELQLSVYSGLLPGMPLTELSVDGLALTLHQDAEGRWRVEGLPRPRADGVDPLDVLEGFGELRVQGARLAIEAERWNLRHVLPRADLRLRVDGNRVRGGARVWPQNGRAPLDLAARLSRDGRNGTFWVGTEAGELAPWSALLAGLGIEAPGGRGRLGVWATLEDRRIAAVQLDADLADLALARLGGEAPATFESARFVARWQAGPSGWQVSVPEGRFRHGGNAQRLDGFWMAIGPGGAVEADRIDAAPLIALAALSDRLPASLSGWLAEAAPGGTVRRLRATSAGDGEWRGEATLEAARFASVGRRPGLSGLGGLLRFDGDGASLSIPRQSVTLDWPAEFGPALTVTIDGELALWRVPRPSGAPADAPTAWGLGTGGLAIAAPGLSLRTRFELGLQGDGTRPTLDLAADLDDFEVVDAKRFWLRTAMPAPARNWLDDALQGGHARGGRVALGGDLDRWPFRDGGGRFDARVRLDDVQLKFHPGWPAASGLSGEAIFYGPGMALQGLKAQLLDTRVTDAGGSIADFKTPWLELGLRGGGDAGGLRRLMVASPLYAGFRSHLDALSASGPAAVDVGLRVPLRRDLGTRRVTGVLSLDNATVADRRWDLRFDRLSGRIPFDDRGFHADALPVAYADHPGRLSLRVGDAVVDRALAAEFGFDAVLPPAVLLARAPELGWLRGWLDGESPWRVRVDIPRPGFDGRTPPSRLRLDSDLVGTRLGLPAPLRKSATTPLALALELPLPVSSGELKMSLGRLLRLRGRLGDGVRPFAGVAEFGSVARPAAIPERGIAVRGQMPSLDVGGWVAAAAGGGAGQGGLQSVDVQVGAIDVLDRSFGDGRVELGRDAQGLRVAFDGPAIAGTVRVPRAEGSRVQGRFARLHWPPVDGRAMTGRPGDLASAVDDTDPSRLPPLDIRVEDFRLGDARLGRAVLETFPTPEGMHVDRFTTDSEALALSASGDWTRIGGRARSRFALDFDARSLGGMLDALGFTGMVEDGPVKARMVGDWPGSPGSFRLDRYDGRLRLDVGKGRLLDVEPGTGRLLGLVSIAEIPRRLTLDFSDFFSKGFTFNAMNGDFLFEAGSATTGNLRIDGPAAEINVSGTTALAAREYDQRVEVLPKAGGVLPAIGAVTAGPAGAALGAVAQAVFQLPLKQATRTVYTVQGPWAAPQVDVVERGPRRAADVPAPSAALPSDVPGPMSLATIPSSPVVPEPR